ncbi:MAG: hypothetical protein IKW27_09860 [Bacteroidales bacterium]|nr:hypothetical protein [Bacteroidales bacterium]
MNMKKIFIIAMLAVAAVSCIQEPDVDFGVDEKTILVGAAGGERTFNVSSSGSWVAMTESPWISVSPANGRGSQQCSIIVDSTLVYDQRTGVVRIQSLDDSDDKMDFEVIQEGFEYQIVLKESRKDVADYAGFNDRKFKVKVKANVDFDVVLPEGSANWLSYTKSTLNLDRGSRPRESVVTFEWRVNSRDVERVADVVFQPKEDVQMSKQDGLKIVQKAALPIPENTPAGDSLAILAVSRALGSFTEFDTSEKMEYWTNVKLWKSGPNKGRVKYVQFFMFKTQEVIPFEIQYLTAAEEIVIYSNANHFLRSLDTGEHITKLTNLKRLTIGAYGLTSLHPDFVNLKNLEYLDLSSNCFQSLPDILCKENFPNLHALVMNANQRNTVYDLSNDTRDNIGGFIDDDLNTESGMRAFKKILTWDNLDTLRLSVNYLQGELPDMTEDGLPVWTFEELKDSLAVGLTELPVELRNVPKVLPNTKFFAINFNRFTGRLPEWILKHPKLDVWAPYSLIFSQEGKTRDGRNAGFSNEPTSLDEYYQLYPNKKYNPNKTDSE